MDRLISLEPSNVVTVRVEPGQKCYGILTLHNVMYTMPSAFRLQPMNKTRYSISPLMAVTLEITYQLPPNSNLPDSFPYSDDSFLLHSVVAPGAAVEDQSSAYDAVPNDWFTTKKKQVFINSGIKVMFVGSTILAHLLAKGIMTEIRDALEKSDQAVDYVDADGRTLLHIAIAQGRPDLVQVLLEFELGVEAHSRSGSTPLEAAAATHESLIVELLLAHRASTERSESSAWRLIHHEMLPCLLLRFTYDASITLPCSR